MDMVFYLHLFRFHNWFALISTSVALISNIHLANGCCQPVPDMEKYMESMQNKLQSMKKAIKDIGEKVKPANAESKQFPVESSYILVWGDIYIYIQFTA